MAFSRLLWIAPIAWAAAASGCDAVFGLDDRPPIDAPPPDDLDDDGVANDDDNCVDVANPMQGDEDGDLIGDVCDLCPANADPSPVQVDGDGDLVGDACDPDLVAMNFRLSFVGFHSASDLEAFTGTARWTVADGAAHNTSAEIDELLLSQARHAGYVRIIAAIRIEGVTTTAVAQQSVGVRMHTVPSGIPHPDGLGCEVYDLAVATQYDHGVYAARWEDDQPGPFARSDFASATAWVVDSVYLVEAALLASSSPTLRCSASGVVGSQSAGISGLAENQGAIGIVTSGLRVAVEYIDVVR